MGENTNVSWADDTWNPWRGCTKVSPGCKNCYAEKLVTGRLGGEWGKGAPRVRASAHTFNAPLRWNEKPWACDACGFSASSDGGQPMRVECPKCKAWPTAFHRRRVFLGSLMDWLDPEVPIHWLTDALDIVRKCPGLDFLMLTKRPEQFYDRMKGAFCCQKIQQELLEWIQHWMDGQIIPANIWIGTSVEDQKRADDRIPELLKIPAKVRFLSVEPLLGPVDLGLQHPDHVPNGAISWVITGGESGPNRRDCGTDAIVSVAEQCKAAGVPCYVKQDCSAKPGQRGAIPLATWNTKEFPKV